MMRIILLLATLAQPVLLGSFGGRPQPVTALAKEADLVVLATNVAGEYRILPISTEPLVGPENFFFPLRHEAAATISSRLSLNQASLRRVRNSPMCAWKTSCRPPPI
jgi:hypothetical protein